MESITFATSQLDLIIEQSWREVRKRIRSIHINQLVEDCDYINVLVESWNIEIGVPGIRIIVQVEPLRDLHLPRSHKKQVLYAQVESEGSNDALALSFLFEDPQHAAGFRWGEVGLIGITHKLSWAMPMPDLLLKNALSRNTFLCSLEFLHSEVA